MTERIEVDEQKLADDGDDAEKYRDESDDECKFQGIVELVSGFEFARHQKPAYEHGSRRQDRFDLIAAKPTSCFCEPAK